MTEPNAPRAPSSLDGSGARTGLLLDIGDDVGGLVVRSHPEWDGLEVEVSTVDDDQARTHAVVHQHQAPSGDVYAAVFVALPAGDYRLWHPMDDRPVVSCTVRPGRVTDVVV
jgi:hypothetical protein